MIKRRKTHQVSVGNVIVGDEAPVVVQSMTNTDTADAQATANQIIQLAEAGSEIVRITVNNEESAKQVPLIREKLDMIGQNVPIVGDFHYNGHTLLTKYPDCAKALAKYRINPGNVGFGKKHDEQFGTMIETAIKYNKPVRIGVNWGSLDQDLLRALMDKNANLKEAKDSEEVLNEALILSALNSAKQAEKIGLPANKIILSCKVSKVQNLIALYTDLAKRCEYPLHLGLTEAGMGDKGVTSSTAALSILLQQGIGDTIRVSLTPTPGEERTREVKVCQSILQAMGIRSFRPEVTACPGCGRTTSTYFQELASDIQNYLDNQMLKWQKEYIGVEKMNVAVMGCIVNGPGESKHADIGISLPGSGESPAAPVFVDGNKMTTLRGDNITEEFKRIVADYVETRFSRKKKAA